MGIEHRASVTGSYRPSHYGESTDKPKKLKRTVYQRTEEQKRIVANALAAAKGMSSPFTFDELLDITTDLRRDIQATIAKEKMGRRNG